MAYLSALKSEGKTIGFAPTMGALHKGHLSLIEKAIAENDVCVTSIFVNPVQFNDKKDLDSYPRTFERDLTMLIDAGNHILFYPDEQEMYTAGTDYSVNINFGYLLQTMEAVFRKGHFEGVAVVVKRLLDIVQPHHLYMGQKDYQQLLVVKKMIETLQMDVQLKMCETIREANGLAMSSRNLLLSAEEKEAAQKISSVLFEAKNKINQHPFHKIREESIAELNNYPLLKTEYFEIVDADGLQPVEKASSANGLAICAAVRAGSIRLIDNIIIS